MLPEPSSPNAGDEEVPLSPVSSHNEWDPLEEVIVERLEGATIPSNHPVVACDIPPWAARLQGLAAGFRYPRFLVERAQQELDQFIALLESLDITVRRPDAIDFRRRFRTPDWSSRGFCNTCSRDSLLVVGDEIIELIAEAVGRPIRLEVVSREAARENYRRQGGFAAANADFLLGFEDYSGGESDLDALKEFASTPAGPMPTAEEVTGVPARTFAEWARDHAGEFRPAR